MSYKEDVFHQYERILNQFEEDRVRTATEAESMDLWRKAEEDVLERMRDRADSRE